MNLKEEDFDLLMMVDDDIDPCLRIVQTSFNNYTAVSITSIGPTGSQNKCSFSTTYNKDEVIYSSLDSDITAFFNIEDNFNFAGANQNCNDITDCATPFICVPKGNEKVGKCTNNKVGVLPGMGINTGDDPKRKMPQHFFMRNKLTKEITTAATISGLYMDPDSEIGTLPVKK